MREIRGGENPSRPPPYLDGPATVPAGMIEITVNGNAHRLEVDPSTPLLWVLRDLLGLTGTKFGCGIGACGACTVLDGSAPARSCQIAIGDSAGRSFTTIEGLSPLQVEVFRLSTAHRIQIPTK